MPSDLRRRHFFSLVESSNDPTTHESTVLQGMIRPLLELKEPAETVYIDKDFPI